MAWVYLIIAGFLEIGWSYYLNESNGFTILVPSLIAIVIIIASFMLLSKAMVTLGIGVSYAIYTGIGTAGIAIIGMLFLGETANPGKLVFLALLLIGIMGLKMSEDDVEQGGSSK